MEQRNILAPAHDERTLTGRFLAWAMIVTAAASAAVFVPLMALAMVITQ